MLDFKIIDISDKERICECLKKSDFQGCEYSFANNMAWRRLSNSKICFYKDFYISCAFDTDDDIPSFIFPSGEGDYREVIDEMRKFSESMGKPLKISGVTEKGLEILKDIYGENSQAFEIHPERDGFDYIYNSSDLINLSGKKYHKKRNHLLKINEYDWEFLEMKESDFDECIRFSTINYNIKKGIENFSSIAEQFAINTFFSYFSEFNLFGGVIRIDGYIKAFSIGEKLNSDTICVHIEKADTSYNGIYPAINNEFSKRFAKDVKYVNREEDMGIEGLRKSKLSYHPAYLLEKNTVIFR
ncbi:MAG: phosphatidylglycerol lysyltransferase domain-containing protein [Oscillospiraceae bacterium]|nr:phosphatidylglycerol lysyltransferase domain-containing protein [Oscillospiraceae bacterium]